MNKVFKIVLIGACLCCLASINVHAQQNHFVYIQADDKLPFDVTVNGATYNSSSIGYVIIPKLNKGNYQFNISFPDKKFPEQQFTCSVDKADAGFALKNYGEKGWGLYNLQSLEITMAAGAAALVTEQITPVEDPGAFGNMLSEVANDSTLNQKNEPIKPEKEKPIAVIDTLSAIKQDSDVAETKNNDDKNKNKVVVQGEALTNAAGTSVAEKLALLKITESFTDTGRDMVFVDKSNGLNDTIRIFLPVIADSLNDDKEAVKAVKTEEQQIAEEKKNPDTILVAKEETFVKKEDTVASDKSGEVNNPFFKKDDTKPAVNNETEMPTASENITNGTETKKQQLTIKPECKTILTENDMDKLKKKMVSADNDEKMIGVAKKNIQDKCITTDQVKSLGALFLSDDSRYNFFNVVYPSVYDPASFSSLESQLIDPAYKKRFLTLLK
ncbi:DUF4476 domain-containing protein [Panacibacter ginsenosidivorans]|uniref:DUF4476 domain-containing protein n=1 Tax=Panacibacter ginsenosidivorans TaxID=1813871 RepID=A0A5B8V888_9BACT|nr:DUF4476 domain-containing protein [Panacibacter ginsenosidivorans]QEC67041.1 DUF4476 domain-containing protein [Panacibacter ginsenosidivorans]